MKLFVLFMITSFNLLCSEILTKEIYIIDVWSPKLPGQSFLALGSDGLVYTIDSKEKSLAKRLISTSKKNFIVEVKLYTSTKDEDKRPKIISFIQLEKFSPSIPSFNGESYSKDPLSFFKVDSFLSMEKINDLFNWLRDDLDPLSQCYNRAHIWSNELFKFRRIKSGKIWMFFTEEYIRTFRFSWWFHVAPYLKLENFDEEIIIDRQYAEEPLPLTDWKNLFIYSEDECKQMNNHSDFEYKSKKAYCFQIKSSMYYWQPWQMKRLEDDGVRMFKFIDTEIERAYQEAM